MRAWPLLVAIGAWATVGLLPPRAPATYVVVLGGDTDGYLSPCGCTKPMLGGIRKRVSLIRSLTQGRRSLVIENGGMVAGLGRQNELKAETLAESLKAAKVDAIHYGYSEARFGQGLAINLGQLSGKRLVTTALRESSTNELAPWIEKGPFLVGGIDMRTSLVAAALAEEPFSPEAAARRLADEAKRRGLTAILMLQGSRSDAEALARKEPTLALIQYRAEGTPPDQPARIGKTLLVTPAGRGIFVIGLTFDGKAFGDYRALKVEATLKDDPDASRLYGGYLQRVTKEGLLSKLPRSEGPAYVGSARCGACHGAALKTWSHSRHARALASLEGDGHGADPECLPCHVVGLSSKAGFVSRLKTPTLAAVGCESCHGPAAAHAGAPKTNHLPKAGQASCAPCHDLEHSPGFVFPQFWKSVAHK